MSQTSDLEQRVAHVEEDLAELKSQVDHLRGRHNMAPNLPQGANPWIDGAGMFRDDPLFDDWQRAITEHRRETDRIADAP